VIVPFFGDQPFLGWSVAELGVGPKPNPRRHLTAERFKQVIQEAIADTAMA
jgi:sterol 3beta-glucosyltransferase